MSDELENRILQFSKLHGMRSEIKIIRKITKTGSVGHGDHKIYLVSPKAYSLHDVNGKR